MPTVKAGWVGKGHPLYEKASQLRSRAGAKWAAYHRNIAFQKVRWLQHCKQIGSITPEEQEWLDKFADAIVEQHMRDVADFHRSRRQLDD